MGGRRRGRWGVRVRVELPVWISTYTSPKTVLVLVRPPRLPRPSRWWLRVRAADAWIRPASGVRTSRAHSVSWETLPRVRSGPGECARWKGEGRIDDAFVRAYHRTVSAVATTQGALRLRRACSSFPSRVVLSSRQPRFAPSACATAGLCPSRGTRPTLWDTRR